MDSGPRVKSLSLLLHSQFDGCTHSGDEVVTSSVTIGEHGKEVRSIGGYFSREQVSEATGRVGYVVQFCIRVRDSFRS